MQEPTNDTTPELTPEEALERHRKELGRKKKDELIEDLIEAQAANVYLHDELVTAMRMLGLIWSSLFNVRYKFANRFAKMRRLANDVQYALAQVAAFSYRQRGRLQESLVNDGAPQAYDQLAQAMSFNRWAEAERKVQEQGLGRAVIDLAKEEARLQAE